MAYQDQATRAGEAELSRREVRARSILDAASTLILRWGYTKTTLDDIARQAGVAKGTLYLHWTSKEDLFIALVISEKIKMTEDIKRYIEQDSTAATLRGLLKYSVLALMKRPLMKAILVRDMDVLGKLAHSSQNSATYIEQLRGFTAYLHVLREQGLVRTDQTLQAQVYIYNAIFTGFFLANPLLPNEFMLADEEAADLIAEAIHRALEADSPPLPAALQAASQALTHYLNSFMVATKDHLQGDVPVEIEPEMLHSSSEARPTVTRARGRNGGRPKKLKTGAKIALAKHMYADKSTSVEEICSTLGISRASLYRYIKDVQEVES